jgi:hypothetical protein
VVTADPYQTTFSRVTEADVLQTEALRLITVETETGTANLHKSFDTIDLLHHSPRTFGRVVRH